MKGTHLGEFEELVLLTVAVCYGNAYAVAICDEIERQARRPASISAVHAALHRLQEKGFLRSEMGGATAERGGRRKRLFEVTSEGRAALEEARTLRNQLWERIPQAAWGGAS